MESNSIRSNRAKYEDELIMGTANDALFSKVSAINTTYYSDPYLKHFIPPSKRRQATKGPIINRGTFLRVNTIDKSLEKFITQRSEESDEGVQVVSLGAGFDTRYFYLRDLLKLNKVKYFEIDFPKLIQQKISLILSKEELNRELTNIELDERKENLNSSDYSLISGDLKEFDKIVDSMKLFGFNTDIPTYFISECVLIYLEPKHSDYIIQWVASNCKLSQIITYEQVGPDDDFGKMMLQNLQMRGIDLKGIYQYPSVESQVERFEKLGFSEANCITLLQSERELLSQEEIDRLNILERLDELEEWELICNHYIFAEAKNQH